MSLWSVLGTGLAVVGAGTQWITTMHQANTGGVVWCSGSHVGMCISVCVCLGVLDTVVRTATVLVLRLIHRR